MSTPPVPAYAQRDTGVQVEQLRQSARRWRRMFRTLIVLLLLLTWLAFTENTSYEYRQTLASVSQRDTNLATAVEHYVVRVMRNARAVHQLLNGLVRDGVSEVGLADMLSDRLKANDAFSDLGVCMPDGRLLRAGKDGASAIGADLCAQLIAHPPRDDEISLLPPR